MSEHGVNEILGMAQDLTDQYNRGLEMGIQIGKRQAFIEVQQLLKENKEKENEVS